MTHVEFPFLNGYCTICGAVCCDHTRNLTTGEYCMSCGVKTGTHICMSCLPSTEVKRGGRPSWPETWMTIAKSIAERSYDPRLKVGAIVVSADNTSMLSVGYNGNYRGGPHEHESKEPGQSGFIHAEVNALVKCDFNFPKKKHMYVTHSPCRACAKLIINAEIAHVVYEIQYRDTSGIELLKSTGIDVMNLTDAILTAGNR